MYKARKLKPMRYLTFNLPYILGALFFLVVLAVIVIAGIASIPRLTQGVITDKTFTEAYTSFTPITITDGNGGAHTYMQPIYHPNSWKLRIWGRMENGEHRAEWWEVGAAIYEAAAVGMEAARDPRTGTVAIKPRED